MTTQAVESTPIEAGPSALPEKTILVTGGAGFIGSNFVNYMYRRYPTYRLVVVDALTYAGNLDYFGSMRQNGRFQFHYGDIRNRDLMDRLVGDAAMVVHFAAESHVSRSIADTASCVSTDVVGTDTVASCVVKHKARIERFIHISTSEVYGTAVGSSMDEEHPLNPCSPYAGAKAGADRLVSSYYLTYGIPSIIVRPFNNYGPHQHLEKLVPRLITSCLLGEPMPIHGDGSAARDWLFVNDNCRAIDMLLHAPIEKVAGEVFNVGTGRAGTIAQIADIVAREMGCEMQPRAFLQNRPGQVQMHCADVRKIAEVVGFRASTTLEEGLKQTIAWYARNRQIWERQLWLRNIEIEVAGGKILH